MRLQGLDLVDHKLHAIIREQVADEILKLRERHVDLDFSRHGRVGKIVILTGRLRRTPGELDALEPTELQARRRSHDRFDDPVLLHKETDVLLADLTELKLIDHRGVPGLPRRSLAPRMWWRYSVTSFSISLA